MPKKFFKKRSDWKVMHWRSEGRPWALVFMLTETMYNYHGSFYVNNYPLIYIYPLYYKNNVPSFGFRMIRLLVYYVQNKNRNFGCSAWIYIFFTGRSNGSETFCTLLLYKLFKFSNLFHNFRSYRSLLNFQITTDCSV